MVSVMLTDYNAFLLEQASQMREIAARLIGRTMNKLCFENRPPRRGANDVPYLGACSHLVKLARLRSGDLDPACAIITSAGGWRDTRANVSRLSRSQDTAPHKR
jgi:hypothetical protein